MYVPGKLSVRLKSVCLLLLAASITSSAWGSACGGTLTGSSEQGQSVGQDKPHLIPIPREVHAGKQLSFSSVAIQSGDADDSFAAKDLEEYLSAQGISRALSGENFSIRLLRADSTEGKKVLSSQNLTFDPSMHEEGYVLVVHDREATIIGETSAGVFYGAQTLKQLVTGSCQNATVWNAVIRDWPAMKYRGIDDDLSRGPVPTLEFQKHQVRTLAAFKINIYSPYLEHTLFYESNPVAAPPGGSLTAADVAELVSYAQQYHVTVLPEQEAFGHLHHVLKYEEYSQLAETPHGHVLAPGQPGSIPLIQSWFTQIAKEFPSSFIHIGADETFELGQGQTKADVQKRGLGPVYADFLAQIHEALKPLNRKLLFWGDVAWSDPTAVEKIPHDMIAVPWWYSPEKSFDRFIVPFKQAGMETWVAPGVADWRMIYPDDDIAFRNIQGFIRDGQRLGSTGAITTVWNDSGEELFQQDWYGVIFGAAAAWQAGESNIDAYQQSYGTAFHGDTSGKIDEAQKELMAAHATLSKGGVPDALVDWFWADPWSPKGQVMASKIRAVASATRLHAERAITLIVQVRNQNPALRQQGALLGMELGARRIDFMAMKFQLADEMITAYQQAYALQKDAQKDPKKGEEIEHLLESISDTNGRCQDLRDGYAGLRDLYQQVWLSENRPYWLQNVLVRFDLAMQTWEARGNEFEDLRDQWGTTKSLPAADKLGLPKELSTSK